MARCGGKVPGLNVPPDAANRRREADSDDGNRNPDEEAWGAWGGLAPCGGALGALLTVEPAGATLPGGNGKIAYANAGIWVACPGGEDAVAMHAGVHAFYQAANGVWLIDHVPSGNLSSWPG